jgi:uroporphyrinogen decarboxylase
MTSVERILAASRRQPADRTPTSLRLTTEARERLEQHLGVKGVNAVMDALDIDLRWLRLPFVGPKDRSATPLLSEGTDFWGCRFCKISNPYNTYYEFEHHPLAEATTVEDVERHDWPSLDWWDYAALPAAIDAINRQQPRAILFFAGGAFETPWYIRGMEQFLMDLYEAPEIAEAICARVEEYYRLRALRVLDAVGDRITVIGSGGDIGTQRGMMLDPKLWRERIKPYTARLISTFKEMGFATFYHSDGAITPVIDDFIGIGLDFLDPIQVGAAGMTPEELFPAFGDRLSFHGAIDEVDLLPNATPDEVYEATLSTIEVLGANNGYVVSPTHQIQGDTPPENVVAIFQAARDYRRGNLL